MNKPASELIALADNIKDGHLAIVHCHPEGLGAVDASQDQRDAIEAALRTAANQSGSERAGVDALRKALVGLNVSLDHWWNGDRTNQRMIDICEWQRKSKAALATPPAQPAPVATHGKPDGAVREALDDVGVFFRLLRGPSYVADAFSLNVTNAEYKKAREGFDKLKAALRDATEKVNWTPFEDGAAPWSEDEQFEERAKACKSRCKQYGYTCGQGGEEDYEYEGECDDCDRDAQEVLRKKYLKPTALQSKIAAAPMFETEEEAAEAADNGRNTGGKSYYRPTENKIAAAETSLGDYDPEFVASILHADAVAPEAKFNNTADMLNWLNRESPGDVVAMKEACKPFLACLVGYDDTTPDSATLYVNVDDDGGCQVLRTEHFRALKAAIDRLDVKAEAMRVIDPEEWEPCSPAYLAAGGKCATAPRVWNNKDGNHYHPKLSEAKSQEPDVVERAREMLKLGIDIPATGEATNAVVTGVIRSLLDEIDEIDADLKCAIAVGRMAAASQPNSGGDVWVKPLEWRGPISAFPKAIWEAKTAFGYYVIEEESASDSPAYEARFSGAFVSVKDGVEDAKAAAQADYEQRIKSALIHTPAVSVDAILTRLNSIAPAVENLACHQEQADMDGCMVKVSRQALDETLEAVNAIAALIAGER